MALIVCVVAAVAAFIVSRTNWSLFCYSTFDVKKISLCVISMYRSQHEDIHTSENDNETKLGTFRNRWSLQAVALIIHTLAPHTAHSIQNSSSREKSRGTIL